MPGASSATAEAFAARVEIARPGDGLCLVAGRAGSPEPLVQAAGGRVVTRLPDPRKLLALLSFEATGALAAHPEIVHAGQVSLDPERFRRFVELVGLDDHLTPKDR